MRKTALLLVPLSLAACDREPIAPDIAGSGGAPAPSLIARDDSITKGAYASWQDGQLSHWVFVSETRMPGSGAQVWLSYGAWDAATYVFAFYGSGFISPDAVQGSGQGILRLRTNIDPAAYPGFGLFNHAGGPIEIVWQAVPRTAWRWHEVGGAQVGPVVIKYNSGSTTRDATAEGDIAGMPIPSTASASLWMNLSHSMLLQPGN